MRAVVATEPGGPEVLRVVQRPDPAPGPAELLVRVAATAVNRADVLQRRGLYPPPPGASDVLGLEASGEVEAVGPGVTGWSVGDPVCAVLPGGGYAELVVVPAGVALPVPSGLSLVEAAAIPEVFTTAYDNVLVRGRLAADETLLVHGGASGVGTAAIQLAKRAGATVLVTAGSPQRVRACVKLGADDGFVYRYADIAAEVRARTDGHGADVILDVVGGAYLGPNLRALAVEGRLVVIGLQGGAKAELDLSLVMTQRLSVAGSTLRARSVAEREPVMAGLLRDVWPGFADGSLRPVVDRVLPLEEAAEAHRVMEASEHIGKIVLRV
ncbi:MAG: NAD(P)H-quinone oxidoreductase [Euzebyaceae bacterium]|jgi:putative PIG3 family NAD(P)H quinone oxidoreductase|nr:NAD(P)H-quinone oxidoreductase [Euzebyaceae bacterium]